MSELCNTEADFDRVRALLKTGTVTHTRFRMWCGQGIIYVYVRRPDSPTGVILGDTLYATPEAEALFTGALSPLSPTEGLGSGR